MKLLNFFAVFILIFSCKSEVKKETQAISKAKKHHVEVINNPVTGNSSLPRLFSTNDKLFLSWIEKKDTIAILKYSVLKNDIWENVIDINSGSDWFVNWADFPAIAESNGNTLTNFLQKSATGTYTYDVKLNLFSETLRQAQGDTKGWKKNFILHDDGTQSEHGFVSIEPYVGGSFFVTWLDGRETVGKGHGGGQMTLRGAIVFEDGSIQYDTLLDDRVCDCCQTSATIGSNDEIIVAYRDRSEDEIRDISIVRWEHKEGWSKPITIGNDQWKIAGCPVNGPSIDAFETTVAVAWFTAIDEQPKVQIAFSKDVGKTFGNPIRLDAGNAIGRVDVAMISEKETVVLWMEPQGEDTLLQLIKVSSDGVKGKSITVSKMSAERSSGFPQLELVGETLYVAWTDVRKESSAIKMAKVSVDKL